MSNYNSFRMNTFTCYSDLVGKQLCDEDVITFDSTEGTVNYQVNGYFLLANEPINCSSEEHYRYQKETRNKLMFMLGFDNVDEFIEYMRNHGYSCSDDDLAIAYGYFPYQESLEDTTKIVLHIFHLLDTKYKVVPTVDTLFVD